MEKWFTQEVSTTGIEHLIVSISPAFLFGRTVLWWYGSERLPPNFDAHVHAAHAPTNLLAVRAIGK